MECGPVVHILFNVSADGGNQCCFDFEVKVQILEETSWILCGTQNSGGTQGAGGGALWPKTLSLNKAQVSLPWWVCPLLRGQKKGLTLNQENVSQTSWPPKRKAWYCSSKGFHSGSVVKNLHAMQKMWVWSLSLESSLEEKMATYSSILATKIPCTEEPRGLQSVGSQRVKHVWGTERTHT